MAARLAPLTGAGVRVMPKVAPHAASRSPSRQGETATERERGERGLRETNGQLTLIRRQHAVTFDVVLVKSGCGCQAAPNPQMMPLYMTICGRNGTTRTHTYTHIATLTDTYADGQLEAWKLKQFGRLSK